MAETTKPRRIFSPWGFVNWKAIKLAVLYELSYESQGAAGSAPKRTALLDSGGGQSSVSARLIVL